MSALTVDTTANNNGYTMDKKEADIARIKVLAGEGKSTDEIAAELGTTAQSLRNFCSKEGLSLRELRRAAKQEPTSNVTILPAAEKVDKKESLFEVSLRIKYKRKTKTINLDLPMEKVGLLFLEAGMGDRTINETFAKLLARTLEGTSE